MVDNVRQEFQIWKKQLNKVRRSLTKAAKRADYNITFRNNILVDNTEDKFLSPTDIQIPITIDNSTNVYMRWPFSD